MEDNEINVKLLELEKTMKEHVVKKISDERTLTWKDINRSLLLYEQSSMGVKADITNVYNRINKAQKESDDEYSKIWITLDSFKDTLNDKIANKTLFVILGGLLTICMAVFLYIGNCQNDLQDQQTSLLISNARIEERINDQPAFFRTIEDLREIVEEIVKKKDLD